MQFLKPTIILGLATVGHSSVMSQPFQPPHKNQTWGCGEVNVFYTGFPGYHKMVIEQGYPPEEADGAIRNSTAEMVAAGYNVAMILSGPEMDISLMADEMKGVNWHVTGIGFGMRGSNNTEVVGRFEENLMLFRQQGPLVPTVFNYNPWTFLWSIERYFPIGEDCTNNPGKLIEYKEICEDACVKVEDRNI